MPTKKLKNIILLLLHGIFFYTAKGQNIPHFTGERVLDAAKIFNSESKHYLEYILQTHEDSTSNQIMVLTVNSLEGYDIETFANSAFRKYLLGQQDKNNGVLLAVAMEERMVRIEVGYGLEGALPDALCGRIIDHEIIPLFREGHFDQGIIKGVQAIISAIKGEYTPSKQHSEDNILMVLVIIVLLIIIISFLFRRKNLTGHARPGGWWLPSGGYQYRGGSSSRGGWGGGGFSGGGGWSGGGGASGRW